MSPQFRKFSSRENLKKAFVFVKKEIEKSNIPSLPLNNSGISAIEELGDEYFIALEKLIRSGNYEAEKTFFIYFPKDNLDVRPVKALSTTDRIVYQALFNPDVLGLHIDEQLEDSCMGNRVERRSHRYFLRNYKPEWNSFHTKQLGAFRSGKKWVVEIDISKFFESIVIPKLCKKLEEDFGVSRDLVTFLEKMLTKWSENDLPKGIPQGPQASWVLANAYFDEIDKFILKKTKGRDIKFFRYADDMVFMASEKRGLADFVREVALHVRMDNLSLNEKTAIKRIKSRGEIEENTFGSYEELDERNPSEDSTFLTVILPEDAKEIIYKIIDDEKVTKKEISNIRLFLSIYHGPIEIDFLDSLLEALFIKPSLFHHGIKFIGSNINRPHRSRASRNRFVSKIISILTEEKCDKYLCVWLLKLAVESSRDDAIFRKGIQGYVFKVLRKSKDIQEVIIALYYFAYLGRTLNYRTFLNLVDRFEGYERNLLLSFITILTDEDRKKILIRFTNSLIRNQSNEANIIGIFLKRLFRPDLRILASRSSIAGFLTKQFKEEKAILSPLMEIPKDYVMVAKKHLIYGRLGAKQGREYVLPKRTKGDVYITKERGKYLFEGNQIHIRSSDAQYAVIFDVVISLKQNGGKIAYSDIIEGCRKRKKRINKKAILRALTGKDANLFRYAKNLKQSPAYGINLFEPMQDGKEIAFNNKK
ncbi:MAG: reverse transcriptase domain-containing protein [Pseudomonadota bacterium]